MIKKSLTIFTFFALLLVPVFAVATNPLSGKYILVIDLQEVWTKKMLPEESLLLIKNVNSVIRNADPEKVVYIESVAANLVLSFSGISIGFPEGLKSDDRLLVVNSNKIIKNKSDSFSAEQLRVFIKNHNAEEFVVVGLAAEHCIIETLLGGLKSGYKMSLIPEAIAGKSAESKTKAINTAKEKGVAIISLHSI